MIGSLRGKLTFKQAPALIIECNGVGYDVETPMSTFFELPAVGDELFLFTHLLVREDAQILYGFATDTERKLFRTVLKVRGIGAKIGLAILSSMSVAGFNRCIEYEDVAALSKIPGIGKKTARTPDHRDARSYRQERNDGPDRFAHGAGRQIRGRRCTGRAWLQGRPAEVTKLIGKLDVDGQSAEDIIRLALRQAAQ